jgi:hypothetical protein
VLAAAAGVAAALAVATANRPEDYRISPSRSLRCVV